ncbi:MAG: WbuC family cupin fold metalloprotein [Candidatus Omnitrophota bacterium]
MIKITDTFLKNLSAQAKRLPRKRINHNFHKSDGDTLQRMINAMEPGTYSRPHKHQNPDKREIFLILKGRIAVIEFDDNGQIIDHVILDTAGATKAVEIPPRTWHSLLSLEEGSAVYELKDGPYDSSTDKICAGWSPEEGGGEAGKFNEELRMRIKAAIK